ncbi:MAG TPA: hypothetical protein PLK94_12825 [Alphaproteobacteria bacterium]|nr:hypothetical protein [Alphaproteobacteria bacterium]
MPDMRAAESLNWQLPCRSIQGPACLRAGKNQLWLQSKKLILFAANIVDVNMFDITANL